jgi:hypothetical protein
MLDLTYRTKQGLALVLGITDDDLGMMRAGYALKIVLDNSRRVTGPISICLANDQAQLTSMPNAE